MYPHVSVTHIARMDPSTRDCTVADVQEMCCETVGESADMYPQMSYTWFMSFIQGFSNLDT